jgi:hypothetical protein
LVVASRWTGHALAENCEFESALYHLEKALEINVAANLLWGISIMKLYECGADRWQEKAEKDLALLS